MKTALIVLAISASLVAAALLGLIALKEEPSPEDFISAPMDGFSWRAGG